MSFYNAEYILDSNIVIYLLQENQKVMQFIDSIQNSELYISVITRMEVLMGAEKENIPVPEIQEYLDCFVCLPITKEIADFSAQLSLKSSCSLAFKDRIIASTAVLEQKILVTADKDFQRISSLQDTIFLFPV